MIPLQTALAAYDNSDPREDDERIVLAAARSVAEGETIWWCETHEARVWQKREPGFTGHDECMEAALRRLVLGFDDSDDCSLVEKILADPPNKDPE